MSAIPMPLQDHEVERALEIARAMAAAGVPIFTAAAAPGTKVGFHLPSRWEETTADPAAVDAWRPGMALCAVGGHVCDFLDVDPRNGGTESAEQLQQAGKWPKPYGAALTPSGGRHELIQPLGVGKGELVAGVDLQGGRPDGGGRGFVFIAPTVRASKVDGVARPYRWSVEPDLQLLALSRGEQSGLELAKLLPERRSKPKARGAVDDFYDDELPHTNDQAQRNIAAKAADVTAAARTGWGAQFRDALNRAAYSLGGYVGSDYMEDRHVVDLLTDAIRSAGSEPDENDLRWIKEGLDDGTRFPIHVVHNRRRPPLGEHWEGEGDFGARLLAVSGLSTLPDPEALVAGWLYRDTTARLVGQAKSFKSFVALDMACCVALGKDWHGRPTAQTRVLYVVGEGLSGYKRRIAAWCETNEVDPAELEGKILFTRGSVQIGGDNWPQLAQWATDNAVGFVIIDTQAKSTVGYEENSNSDQAKVFAYLDGLRQETGGTLLLLHHTGHTNGDAAERGRGASSWRGAVDSELLLTKTGDRTAILRNDAQKDAESGEQVGVRMLEARGSLAVQIESDAPLSARDQWITDQVYAGVRYPSQTQLCSALRDAGHGVRNDDKAQVFETYHTAVQRASGVPVGITPDSQNPFVS